jgi:hypothetical protein
MKDHLAKKPTQAEDTRQMVESLMRTIPQIYQVMGDLDRRIAALARAKMEPEPMALFILDGEHNREYMGKVTEAIKLETERRAVPAPETPPT